MFGVMWGSCSLLGEHLGPAVAVFRVSAVFPLDANWSWVGCLNVNQQCKSKLPESVGELMVLTKIPVDAGGL